MKKKIIPLLFALLIIYCLIFPAKMAASVTNGLVLWYHSILPTLLPFCIFSNIIVCSGIYDHVFEKLNALFKFIYPVRPPLIYPLVCGFLFGFPLGSKICADLYHAKKINTKEAETISCISNNFGPAFLYNYLFLSVFDGHLSVLSLFAACYMPPLILGKLVLNKENLLKKKTKHRQKKQNAPVKFLQTYNNTTTVPLKKPASRSQLNMKIIDAGIMDGFTTMIRLAGYILLSALLADFIKSISFQNTMLQCICIGAMEITNGIHQITLLSCSFPLKAMLAIGIVNFGGVSGILQTYSMLKTTHFRLCHYVAFKLMCSILGIIILSILLILKQVTCLYWI